MTASYSGHNSGTPTWLCYRSSNSTGPITTAITCSNPGTSSTITASGSGNGVMCTPSETDGSSVSLTWVESTQKYIRARACTANGDTQQGDKLCSHWVASFCITWSKNINPGGNITATYTNRLQGRPTWLCYLSGTSPIGTSPVCGDPGTSYTITSSGSGSSTVQCTASETSASSIDLTWADSTQSNIRVRACTSSGDDLQYDNANVQLNASRINVTITPLTANEGDTLTASYSGHNSGTPTWLCYRSSNSTGPITTAITCSNPGTSSTITASGSGNGVMCTPSETDGSSVSLTWVESTQKYIRARACTANGDTQQVDNDYVRIGLPVSVSLGPKMINPGGNITATYTNRLQGRPTWLCYLSGTSPIGTSPVCGDPGTSYTITSSGSGSSTVQCTASETSASSIDLTWADSTQSNIRVRACTSSGDDLQYDNANVQLNASRINVTITPLTANEGDTLTASYSGHNSGTPTWLCYRSSNSTGPITTAITCSNPGTSSTITASGSGNGVMCTPSETDGSSVSLTWVESTQKYIRARACTANGDTQQGDNDYVRIGLPVSVSLGPKMINPGGNITATYTNRLQGRPTWLCYLSGTSPIGTSPVCGDPGTSYTITSSGSGSSTVQCTASETSASSIDLTWADSTQSNIRVRACTSSGDDLQYDNANVQLNASRINVTITPLTANEGDTLTASYSGHVSGTPTWLCYRSSNSTGPITTAITCSNPGTSSTITASGSGNGVMCTPSETDGSSVSLTWVESTQKYIRARACTANGDTQQVDNDYVRIGLPVSVSLGPKMINPGGNITATYTNRLQGRPTWLCYLSGTSPIGTSPVCGDPGTSYTITSSGSGSSTVQCTASETSASSIDLTLGRFYAIKYTCACLYQ